MNNLVIIKFVAGLVQAVKQLFNRSQMYDLYVCMDRPILEVARAVWMGQSVSSFANSIQEGALKIKVTLLSIYKMYGAP